MIKKQYFFFFSKKNKSDLGRLLSPEGRLRGSNKEGKLSRGRRDGMEDRGRGERVEEEGRKEAERKTEIWRGEEGRGHDGETWKGGCLWLRGEGEPINWWLLLPTSLHSSLLTSPKLASLRYGSQTDLLAAPCSLSSAPSSLTSAPCCCSLLPPSRPAAPDCSTVLPSC